METDAIIIDEFKAPTGLIFITQGTVVSIAFSDIESIRREKGKTIIFTSSRQYPGKVPLGTLWRDLPVNDFVRINKSCIVSIRNLDVHEISNHYAKQIRCQLACLLEQRYRQILYKPVSK